MIIDHISNTKIETIKNDKVKNTSMQVLIGESEGWKDHVMRVFSVEPGGHTPHHNHPWPHINYVLNGTGTLEIDGTLHPLKEGSYAYVDDSTTHQFKNTGDTILQFICIVPKKGHK